MSITPPVRYELLIPELRFRLGFGRISAPTMIVPKATVNKMAVFHFGRTRSGDPGRSFTFKRNLKPIRWRARRSFNSEAHQFLLRSKGRYERRVRHLAVYDRRSVWRIELRRYGCLVCKKSFIPELPGIMKWRHCSEGFRRYIYQQRHDGICASTLADRERIGSATVERIYRQFTDVKARERMSLECPRILGIDKHTLHKKQRFATTFCDLKNSQATKM